jgi:hypothetical protein
LIGILIDSYFIIIFFCEYGFSFIFLHVASLWDFIFSLFGLDWVVPWRVVDLFACWRGQFGSFIVQLCGRWFCLA